ncbi:hypothetical protein EDD86DRAFT_208461 [Gorgonomyces haynaldii]|nr:hypothetical protein EDD86DRAFT_208461 [Gorgonomyces haynaldii]
MYGMAKSLAYTLLNNYVGGWLGYKENEFPRIFERGAKEAIPVAFKLLQNHANDIQDDIPLSDILREPLLSVFEIYHESMREQGLKMKMELLEISQVQLKDINLVYGDPENVKSSLVPAPVKHYSSANSWFRKGQDLYYFDESVVEYVLTRRQIQMEDGVPSMTPEQRTQLFAKGCLIGLDVEANLVWQIQFEKDGQVIYDKTIGKRTSIRFETDHFKQRYDGQLKIADIDNFMASKMFE